MDASTIAGTLSTTLFAVSNVPMLWKAARTRSLRSYSLTYLLISNAANMVHWVYVLALPAGPVWILHSFYTLSAALLLLAYVRYEIRPGGASIAPAHRKFPDASGRAAQRRARVLDCPRKPGSFACETSV